MAVIASTVKKLLTEARAASVAVIYASIPQFAETDVVKELAPTRSDPFVQSFLNKFLNTDLEKILKDKGITTIIVVGLAANGAVIDTSSQAVQKGFGIVVPGWDHPGTVGIAWAAKWVDHVEDQQRCAFRIDFHRFQFRRRRCLHARDDVLRTFSSLTRISQVEATDRKIAFRLVNLVEIATGVAELFDAAAENKGGRVEVIGDKSVRISADRDLLFDAISNLVDNAIKHGREGCIVIVSVEKKDREAVLSISDDGPGIPPDEFEHVFKRFYRLERSRSVPGNGLGLSLVAAVVRLHALASRYLTTNRD